MPVFALETYNIDDGFPGLITVQRMWHAIYLALFQFLGKDLSIRFWIMGQFLRCIIQGDLIFGSFRTNVYQSIYSCDVYQKMMFWSFLSLYQSCNPRDCCRQINPACAKTLSFGRDFTLLVPMYCHRLLDTMFQLCWRYILSVRYYDLLNYTPYTGWWVFVFPLLLYFGLSISYCVRWLDGR